MTQQVHSESSLGRGAGWKALMVVILLLTVIIGGLWYWKTQNTSQDGWSGGAPVDVKVIRLKGQESAETLELPGELKAEQQVMLTSEVAGKVVAIEFTAGQRVSSGDVLVKLDTSVEEADLAAARAREAFARKQLERARRLAPSGAMTEEMRQQRLADYDQASAELARLEARIQQKQIRAPFDGEIGIRHVDLGQYLNPGDTAASLTNLSELFVNFDVSQRQAMNIHVGQPIRLVSDLDVDTALSAEVSALEPQVNPDTRNLRVQARMGNEGQKLRPGMYVSVRLDLHTEPDALLLPASAILTSAYGDSALVVRDLNAEQIGKPKFVPVTISRRIGDQVVVGSGLQVGDLVVTEGQLRVQPNSQLKVVGADSQIGGNDQNMEEVMTAEGGQS
ncbi:efflux RND transporter periplasmic adaptor subunit [Marinobacterium iners]|uniref:Membrane fusion protein, multidrug efflux system n=1 Tax=Marinobacterium iners DSM 11526 TaxID=1122198 RepID=A0A1H4H0L5_9GAMM|nr:efflux RND transporter periplasmic adaptor subunit [Marinobacterium iners]SEB15286.1 membrane fusion protein, multidrug efflux system [Marinobacterium iners DSM 11526]